MRKLTLCLIALVPCSPVKRWLYRACFGYEIGAGTRIGLCFLDAKKIVIGANCRLHSFVVVRRASGFHLGDRVTIGPMNLFTTSVEEDHDRYEFCAGDQVHISRSHRFDLSENIFIGAETVVGGVSGAFWTHGAWREHQPIRVGKKCFISDGAQILPGVTLGDNTLVSVGAVVSAKEYPANCVLMGNPARLTQKDFIWWQKEKAPVDGVAPE